MFNPRIAWSNRIAWEFDIFGDFACDLVVGEWEEANTASLNSRMLRSESIFSKQGKKATREWGRRFDHGYSQVIDWAHKLDGRSMSADFLARFGRHEINYEAALVIGREKHLDEGEKQRLSWRSDKVVVNNKKVTCVTFDGLISQLSSRLRAFFAVEAAAGAAALAKTAESTGTSPTPSEP